MIVQFRLRLVSRLTTFALLSTKRHLVATAMSNNKTILDRMLSPSDLADSPFIKLEHIQTPVQSTQDEARRILHERAAAQIQEPSFLAVMADVQLQGRGTTGRSWEGDGNRTGNLYLTICVPLQEIPVQITLLPLQIAVLVAQRASQLIQASAESATVTPLNDSTQKPLPKVTVKWPNDVLINEHKLSGTLIESEIVLGKTWFLIGIGVNIAYAPNLTRSSGKMGRPATCLQDHLLNQAKLPQSTAAFLGSDLTHSLVNWIMDKSDKERREKQVIERWKFFAEFGKQYELRGQVSEENNGKHVGEKVMTVDIQGDGQLRVRGQDGRERLLIADYLF
jgi:biotin-(acetyl-CoA carboxylase) ligase